MAEQSYIELLRGAVIKIGFDVVAGRAQMHPDVVRLFLNDYDTPPVTLSQLQAIGRAAGMPMGQLHVLSSKTGDCWTCEGPHKMTIPVFPEEST